MDKGPFLPYPDKLDYMWRDLERRSARHGLEYKRPGIYPPASRLAMRIGVLAAQEGWCREFTEAVFRLHWVEGRYIGTDDNLETALASVGKDLKMTVAAASDPTMDSAVDAQVARAKELRIFGARSFTVGNELFWGGRPP
jgi:2-hydroxychromene-2-carboxylate isomerase